MKIRDWVTAALAVALVASGAITVDAIRRSAGSNDPDGARATGLVLPPGVSVEIVAKGLSFPTALDWDASGVLHVGEAFSGRVLRIEDGRATPIDVSRADYLWAVEDITFHDGELYLSSAGIVQALDPETGGVRTVVDGLPTWGDHGTSEITFGPDGRLYVGIGSVTNTGVLGFEQGGVLNRVNDVINERPALAEVPCEDVRLAGVSYETMTLARAVATETNANEGAARDARVVTAASEAEARALERDARARERVVTGPFLPFGEAAYRGQVIRGNVLCTGSVVSFAPDGSDARVEAWGIRNPFGVKVDASGVLWVSENAPDARGSRPTGAAPDVLHAIERGPDGARVAPWRGWPDYVAGLPLTHPFFAPPWGEPATKLLLDDPNPPPRPFTFLGAHASANKFDFAPAGTPFAGDVFIAQLGTLGSEYRRGAFNGMSVARIDRDSGRVTDFIVPQERWSGAFRPIEARFGPDGRLYVVDFGEYRFKPGTGNGTGYDYFDDMRPETGRILAFTLPAQDVGWEGVPAGNPGGKGEEPRAGGTADPRKAETSVTVFDFGFASGFGKPRVGVPIVFHNVGDEDHTATEDRGAFNSGFTLPRDGAFAWTPKEAGTYRFYCAVHPGMRGEVVVAPG